MRPPGLTNANNTSDAAKPISTAVQTALDGKKNARIVTAVAVNTTAAAVARTEYIYLVSGTTTLTLPTAVGNTAQYVVKNSGAGTVTLATTSSQTINGSLSFPDLSAALATARIVSDNANWWTV